MLLSRTRSNAPGHIAIDDGYKKEVTSGSVSSDGRFKLLFRHDTQGLADWAQNIQRSLRQPQRDRGIPAGIKEDSADGPKPRLNIAIHIVGSRGDVQPFIPIAQMLSKPPYGYRVRICTHPAFKDFVESQGIEFFSIGGDPEALMAYMVKNPGLLPNRKSVKDGDIGKRRSEMWEIINGCWRGCIEAGNGMGEPIKAVDVPAAEDLFLADAIIANPPSMAHIHCAEKLGIPLHMVFTMPWSPTEFFGHPLAALSGGADPRTANYLSFVMMELLTWQGLGDLINKFRRQKLFLDPISPMWGFQLLSRLHVPFNYLWSSSLIPKPSDWGSHINITGFSFLPLAHSYTPPPDLTAFLEKGPPPIYIGFGSIVVDDPEALTQMVFKAVKMAGVRAIVSKGWSGVGGEDNISDDIYLIGNCPHDWLFERVSAVVHHGGAGTTAAGIAAGRPTVVVPFFGDQPFWGQMVARSGAGPEPVPFKEMTAEILAASITFALRPDVQVAAREMAKNIAQENGAVNTAGDFQERLDAYQFQCDLCPGRLASHRHKKTGARLSGFAACCLVDKGLIQPHELKILKHQSWYVDEGAEHPLVGLAAAFTGTVYAVAIATSDYWHALKRRPQMPVSESKIATQPEPPAITVSGAENNTNGPANGAVTHHGPLKKVIDPCTFTPKEMDEFAKKVAKKSTKYTNADDTKCLKKRSTFHDKQKAAWQAREQGQHGRVFYITRATGRYGVELTKAGLKAPVAFFYNIANGFHNYPSYGFAGVEVRRRDQITGLGSGIRTAGKEFTLGIWDAFSGIVVHPYKSTRDEHTIGLGKGLWRVGKGFVSNIGAAVFGLLGYTLKGVEKELQKHHLTNTRAEIILIRLRQGIDDFRRATPEEREEVVMRWNARA